MSAELKGDLASLPERLMVVIGDGSGDLATGELLCYGRDEAGKVRPLSQEEADAAAAALGVAPSLLRGVAELREAYRAYGACRMPNVVTTWDERGETEARLYSSICRLLAALGDAEEVQGG